VAFENLGCGEVYKFRSENVLSKAFDCGSVVEHEVQFTKNDVSKCTSSPL